MAKQYDIALKIAGKVDPSLVQSANKASGLISSIVKADLIASGIKSAASAVTSFAVDSVKSYASFEQSLANAGAIAGATGADLQAMKDAAMEAGRTTQFTAGQSADALGYMALAGWDTKTSIQALQPVLKMAQATGADLATTSDQVTDSMSAMGIEVKDLNSYLDVLVTTNNKSNTTASALMEAMIGAGSAAKAAGMDYKQTATALGVLANNGIKGAEAGTALNSMLSRMTSNKQALNAYKQLGVNVFDANGKIRDFGTILKETDKQLSKLSDEKRAAIIKDIAGVNYGGQYQFLLKGVRAIDGQASEWEKLKENIDNAGGSLETMNARATATLTGAWSRFQSAIDGARLALIDKFSPQLTSALDYISNNVFPPVTKGIERITSFLVSFGKTAIEVGSIIFGFAGDTESVGLQMSLASKYGQGLYDKFRLLREIFFSVKENATLLYNNIKNAAIILFELGAKADYAAAKTYILENYGTLAASALEGLKTVLQFVASALGTLASWLIKAVLYFGNVKQVVADLTGFYQRHETAIKVIGIALGGLTVALGLYNKALIVQMALQAKGAVSFALFAAKYYILTTATTVLTAATSAFGAVMAFVTSPIFLVVAAITAVVAAAYLLYKNWDKVTAFIKVAWDTVCGAIKSAWDWLCNGLKLAWQMYIDLWKQRIEQARAVWSAICGFFSSVWQGVCNYFTTSWNNAVALFSAIWNGVKTIFSVGVENIKLVINGITDFIKNVFAGNWSGAWNSIIGIFSGIFENLKTIAVAPLNWIIDKVNAAISAVNSVKVPDWVPGVGGMGANIPTIPALASGGVVTKPTMALIGEGNESEAVMPLSKLSALMNGQDRGSFGDNVSSFMNNTAGASQTGGDSITFAPVININGGSGSKDEISQAVDEAFNRFKALYNQLKADERRRSFSY